MAASAAEADGREAMAKKTKINWQSEAAKKDYDAARDYLRLLFSDNRPEALAKVKGCQKLAAVAMAPVQSILQLYIRI